MKAFAEILPPAVVDLCAALQQGNASRLGGGAALAGFYLGHRFSDDLDLFFADREEMRTLLLTLADRLEGHVDQHRVVQDAGSFVRVATTTGNARLKLDLVFDPQAPLTPPIRSEEGIRIESFRDLFANKITCLLSRAEPRDLVDCFFIEQQPLRLEDYLADALTKDAGIDPATLAWLLRDASVRPLPRMRVPLDGVQLTAYRDELAERLRRLAVPPEDVAPT